MSSRTLTMLDFVVRSPRRYVSTHGSEWSSTRGDVGAWKTARTAALLARARTWPALTSSFGLRITYPSWRWCRSVLRWREFLSPANSTGAQAFFPGDIGELTARGTGIHLPWRRADVRRQSGAAGAVCLRVRGTALNQSQYDSEEEDCRSSYVSSLPRFSICIHSSLRL